MYVDRKDAGRQLAKALIKFKDEGVVVLAIPRGGLPLGLIVAQELKAPLDVVLSKKIGHPHNREYAIGAVSLDNVTLSRAMGVTKGYIREETAAIREKLKKRYQQYYKNRTPKKLKNKTVIIVDDGVATGNTILITLDLIQKHRPNKIIIAIPVGSLTAIENLKNTPNVDEVICLKTPQNFTSVGQFYEEFAQVSDKEAISMLEESNSIK